MSAKHANKNNFNLDSNSFSYKYTTVETYTQVKINRRMNR